MKKILKQSSVLILSLGLLTACSSLFGPIKTPEVSTYQLQLDEDAKVYRPGNRSNLSLLMTTPKAEAGFDTEKMAYIETPYQLAYFSRHRWVDTPAKMILPLMVESLEETDHFKAVLSPPFSGVSDLRLDSELIKLQQNFIAQPAVESLEMHVRLVKVSSQQVIATKRFVVNVPIDAKTPYAGVYAANQAVEEFLYDLSLFVVKNT